MHAMPLHTAADVDEHVSGWERSQVTSADRRRDGNHYLRQLPQGSRAAGAPGCCLHAAHPSEQVAVSAAATTLLPYEL